MKRSMALLTLASVLFLTGAAWAQGLPTAKPEEVGISSERLQRVSRALRGEIDSGKIPGAVALVARKGRVVYFESFGVRDKAVGDPMPKDAIFRLYSMTKPFTSVAAMRSSRKYDDRPARGCGDRLRVRARVRGPKGSGHRRCLGTGG
jgi:CubicO group peptidase (beta-lactamase class C family)